jgi:polyhydroxyalkanoate synthase subunit PhaC
VHLLEWLPASRQTGNNGLAEYMLAISECVVKLTNEDGGSRPFLMGHSLGGTLAAIYSAISPATTKETANNNCYDFGRRGLIV